MAKRTYEQIFGVRKAKEIKQKIAIRSKMNWQIPEFRQKMQVRDKNMSEKMEGTKFFLGKHHTEETKQKISKARKGMRFSEEHRENISLAKKGKSWGHHSEEYKERLKKERKGKGNPFYQKHHSEETRKKISSSHLGRPFSEGQLKSLHEIWKSKEFKEKESKTHKKLWADPKYRENQIRKIFEGSAKNPTKLEQRFDTFFKQNNLPFYYCGNRIIWIDTKNPDFITHVKKLVIEVGDREEKRRKREGTSYLSWQDYEQKRKKHFAEQGFDCLCLWEDELKEPEKLLMKIKGAIEK